MPSKYHAQRTADIKLADQSAARFNRSDLPGSHTAAKDLRFCAQHKELRPQEGGCSVGPDRWICNLCWLSHPLLTGKNKKPR